MSGIFLERYRPRRAGARRCAVLAAGKGVIWLVAGLHAAAAIIVLGRVGLGWARELPGALLHAGAWMIAAACWLAALNNLGSGDVWSMAVSAPVSALLALLATVVALRRADETRRRFGGHLPRGA